MVFLKSWPCNNHNGINVVCQLYTNIRRVDGSYSRLSVYSNNLPIIRGCLHYEKQPIDQRMVVKAFIEIKCLIAAQLNCNFESKFVLRYT